MKTLLKLVIGLTLAVPISARAATEDFQTWQVVNLSKDVVKNVPVTLELSGRLVDETGRLGILIFRPAIGYRINNRMTLSVGYLRQKTINRGGPDVDENRIHQQLLWQILGSGKVTLISRTRLEQRRIEGAQDTGWRLRERLQLQLPLNAERANLVVAHEMFLALNSTDWGARAGFDQMRNFVGVNFPIGKGMTVETGYQNRYQRRQGLADRVDHIVPVILNISL